MLFYQQADDEKHNHYLDEAVKSSKDFEEDISLISGEMDKVKTGKYLLSLFSPILNPLLSTSCHHRWHPQGLSYQVCLENRFSDIICKYCEDV